MHLPNALQLIELANDKLDRRADAQVRVLLNPVLPTRRYPADTARNSSPEAALRLRPSIERLRMFASSSSLMVP